jgi:hypothetical protein
LEILNDTLISVLKIVYLRSKSNASMNNKLPILLLAYSILCWVNPLSGQMYVTGEFYTSASSQIYVEGNFEIDSTGEVDHNGTLTIKGDVLNAGTNNYQSAANSGSWILAGTVEQAFDFNADTLSHVVVNNDAGISGANVVVGDSITFSSGKWHFGEQNAWLLATAITSGADNDTYIVADTTGVLYIDYAAAGSKIFPIGTEAYYAPLELDPQGANRVGARIDTGFYEDPETPAQRASEFAVDLTWVITTDSAITSGDLSLSYPGAVELTNFDRTTANILSWAALSSTSYTVLDGTTTGSDPYTTGTVTPSFTGGAGTYYLGLGDSSFFRSAISVAVACFLEGPFNGTDMNTGLSTGGSTSVLAGNALTQPYSGAPWGYTGTETVDSTFFDTYTNVVDWLLVELRDAADSSVIVAQTAVFLLADGTVIDTAGTATASFSVEPAAYFVAIRHRNHAAVRSLNPIDLSGGSGTWDIRTDDTDIYGTVNVKQDGSNYLLYGGDGTADNDITSADQNVWLNDNGNIGLYLLGDFNLSGDVQASDQNIWLANNGIIITPL